MSALMKGLSGRITGLRRDKLKDKLEALTQQHEEDQKRILELQNQLVEALKQAVEQPSRGNQVEPAPPREFEPVPPVAKPEDLQKFIGKDDQGNRAVYLGVLANRSAQPTCIVVGADTSARWNIPQDVTLEFSGTKVTGVAVGCYPIRPWLIIVELPHQLDEAPPLPRPPKSPALTLVPPRIETDVALIRPGIVTPGTVVALFPESQGVGSVPARGSVELGDVVARQVEGGWEVLGIVMAISGSPVREEIHLPSRILGDKEFCIVAFGGLMVFDILEICKGSWYWEKYPARREPTLVYGKDYI